LSRRFSGTSFGAGLFLGGTELEFVRGQLLVVGSDSLAVPWGEVHCPEWGGPLSTLKF
jgi:hypothetical protein